MRKHELAEAYDPGVVPALVKVELAQKLPDLQRVFERCFFIGRRDDRIYTSDTSDQIISVQITSDHFFFADLREKATRLHHLQFRQVSTGLIYSTSSALSVSASFHNNRANHHHPDLSGQIDR